MKTTVTIDELAEIAYKAYWERVTPKRYNVTRWELHSEEYKEDWRKVVRSVLEAHGVNIC